MQTAIQKAIEAAGGVKALADHAGVTSQAISQWTRIPAKRVPAISLATKIPRHELRPDLWEAPTSIDRTAA